MLRNANKEHMAHATVTLEVRPEARTSTNYTRYSPVRLLPNAVNAINSIGTAVQRHAQL